MHPIHNIYVVQKQLWCIDKAYFERKMSHRHCLFYFQHAVSGTDGVDLLYENIYSRMTMQEENFAFVRTQTAIFS